MMSNEFREIIEKRIKEVGEKWEKIFNQEVQQKINVIRVNAEELRKTFKKETKKNEDTDS